MAEKVMLYPLVSRNITLVGVNDDVGNSEFGASAAIPMPAAVTGEIISVTLHSTESGTGAVQEVNGTLWFFSADPEISAGDTDVDAAAKWETAFGFVDVTALDWKSNTLGKVWHKPTLIPFGSLSTLWGAFQMDGSSAMNDAAGDDEKLTATVVVRVG